ncbi:MAG: hypothetical protein U0V72_04630 [Cytophagales bacterium]
MKKTNNILSFILGIFFGIALFGFIDSERKKRLKLLSNKIDNGFENDSKNIANDFSNIGKDISNSIEKMKLLI